MDSPQHKEECREITPKQHYRYFSVDALSQNDNYYVLRAANTQNVSDVFNNGIFRINALLREPTRYSETAGLSLNLLGGYFTEIHLKYIQKGDAASYWTEGAKTEIDELTKHISVEEGRVPIYFSLFKLHALQIPFEKNIEPKQVRRLPPGLAVEGEKQGEYKVEAILKIKHAPTNANFWHVEFELIDPTRNSDAKTVKDIRSYKLEKEFKDQHPTTKLVHSLLNKIKFLAKKEVSVSPNSIPESVYIKADETGTPKRSDIPAS